MRKFVVKSHIKDYQVIFTDNIKKDLKEILKDNKYHLLIDANIWQIYKDTLSFLGKEMLSVKIFNPLEKYKNIDEISVYIKFLLKHNIQKKHKLMVVGGGLVQDVGSFTSHILMRGIEWVFIPTTLLSMADSCIGSKSGINVGKYKNQVGSFHPPIKIYIYSRFVKTLSGNDLINGIGEIIKHGLVKGGEDFDEMMKNISNIKKDKKLAEKMIYKSLLIKKEIVEEDELEKGKRKLLNYGHTFGHALEGYTNNRIPHGAGVLVGMDIANFVSVKRKILTKKEFEEIHDFIMKFIPYSDLHIKDINRYMRFLSRDKKVVGDEVNAILCMGVGRIKIIKIKLDSVLRSEVRDYLGYFNNAK